MKGLFLFTLVIYVLVSVQATYVRVINAVPGTQVLDVYYNVPNSNQKIRFFQDLNSTDIPPYFFLTIPNGDSSVSFTFMFKEKADYFGLPATPDQLANMPTYNASIRAGGFIYTLIIASPLQNQSNLNLQGTVPCPLFPESISDSMNQSNYQFLLLNDRSQGDKPPSGVQFIRLVNLAPQASSISLVTMGAECPQASLNQTLGNQSQGYQNSKQTGNQMIVGDLPYLQSSDYVELPQGTYPQQLAVCYQGEKIPVVDSLILKQNAKQFSILLFTGVQQNQTGSQIQGQNQTEVLSGSQEQNQTQKKDYVGVQEQKQTQTKYQVEGGQSQNQSKIQISGNQTQSQNQTQEQVFQGPFQSGAFLATLTDDEPDTTQNVRIRVIHAYPSIPTVAVLFDGREIASNLEFGNVTEYMLTNRGIHNITILPSSSYQNMEFLTSITANPIVFFLAWKRTYTIAIVPISIQSKESVSNETGVGSGIVSQSVSFPGFRSFYYQILVDEMSQSAVLGQSQAYIQVVHLASNVNAVGVCVGDHISDLLFLQSSHYINVSTSETIITLSESGNVIANVVSRNLQPRTLYTVWIQTGTGSEPSGAANVRVFVTVDRRVAIRCVLEDEE